MSYKSLKQIYSENVVGKPVPPLPRQSVRLFIKEEDDAVKVYKQEADDPATLEGEVDKEYYNDVISPAITRGGNSQLAKIVKQRLTEAGCYTDRNYNLLIDFLQSLNITLTEKIFKDCESMFVSSMNQASFTFVSLLSKVLQTNGQSITPEMIMSYSGIIDLKNMRATEKTTSEERSGNAGPGEVFIAFFTNGKKLYYGKKEMSEENKGDIEIGGMRMELKGIEGRLKINSSQYPIPPVTYFKTHKDTCVEKIKYLAFGLIGQEQKDFEPFRSEVEDMIANKDSLSFKEARNIAGCITFKVYCMRNRLSYFVVFNQKHNQMGCMPISFNSSDSLQTIQSKIRGKFYLAPHNKDGHSLELGEGEKGSNPVISCKKEVASSGQPPLTQNQQPDVTQLNSAPQPAQEVPNATV